MPEVICTEGHVIDSGRETCYRCGSGPQVAPEPEPVGDTGEDIQKEEWQSPSTEEAKEVKPARKPRAPRKPAAAKKSVRKPSAKKAK